MSVKILTLLGVLLVHFCTAQNSLSYWRNLRRSDCLRDGLYTGRSAECKNYYIGRVNVDCKLLTGNLLLEDEGTRKAGLYVNVGGVEQFYSSGIEFYSKNPTCKYSWIRSSKPEDIPNAVLISRESTYFVLGDDISSAAEALVCTPIPSSFAIFWKLFSESSSVPSDALSAGVDSAGNEIYIGRGVFNGEVLPGRILFSDDGSKDAGLYVVQGNCELYFSNGVEYYSKNSNCDYQWVSSSNGAIVANAVRISKSTQYYIGRFNDGSGLVLGKVSLKEKFFFGPSSKSSTYDVLVCNPITAPTSAAPTVAPTSPPGSSCTTVCTSAILDTINCRCCAFSDYTEYSDLKTQLEEIKAKFVGEAITSEIQTNIDDLTKNLQDIETSVISTCGSEPAAGTLDGFFSFATSSLGSLKVKVAAFDFSFKPGTVCSLSCDEAGGEAPIWKTCKCTIVAGYERLYALRATFNAMFNLLIKSLFDTTQYYVVFDKYQVAFNYLWEVTFGIQYSRYTDAEIATKITEVETGYTTSNSSVTTYLTTGDGICGSCTFGSIADAADSCTCRQTNAIIYFYNAFMKFLQIENDINGWDYKGDTVKEQYFNEWAKWVRSMAVSFYFAVLEDSLTETQIQTKAEEFESEFLRLEAEWKVYAVEVTEAPCEVTCSGDTVKNCNPCECSEVIGWYNLINVIRTDISTTLSDISALADDGTGNKATLTSNTNTVSGGIDTISSYVSGSCSSLDLATIRTKCTELTNLYSQVKTDVIAVRNAAATGTCSITCPSNWVKDATACSCTCLPFTCSAGTQAIDPYNCQCAAKSSCTKTQDECAGSSQILDYAACECKARP